MNSFQIIAIALLSLLVAICVLAMRRGRFSRKECFLWCSLWGAAGTATLWPDLTSHIANMAGIGRGADLVSYCGIVVMLVGFWLVYLHLRRMRMEITILVRELALLEADHRVLSSEPPPNSES